MDKMNNKAFTLIELIVVMAIIAILVLLAAPRFLGYTKDANNTAVEQDMKVLANASEIYHIDNEEWPIDTNADPITLALGGVNEVYRLDSAELKDKVSSLKGDYDEYGIVTQGDIEGEIIQLDELLKGVGEREVHVGEKQPIVFDSVSYQDIGDAPTSPVEWFDYTEHLDGVEINGFDMEFITNNLNGSAPTKVSIPSKINGKNVVSIAGATRDDLKFTSVEELVLPNTLIEIGEQAFFRSKITDLVIPNSVEVVGRYAFAVGSVENVTFGTGLKVVEHGGFELNKITSVKLPDSIEEIHGVAFYRNRIEEVILPNKYIKIVGAAFNRNSLPDDKAFFYQRNKDGSLNKEVLVSYGGADRTHVEIPEGVKELPQWALFGNLLKGVTIPDSVEIIGKRAFDANGFKEVELPRNVRYVKAGKDSSFLESVTISHR